MKALYSYAGRGLQIKEGKVMLLLDQTSLNWARKRIGDSGYLPANYVKKAEPKIVSIKVKNPVTLEDVRKLFNFYSECYNCNKWMSKKSIKAINVDETDMVNATKSIKKFCDFSANKKCLEKIGVATVEPKLIFPEREKEVATKQGKTQEIYYDLVKLQEAQKENLQGRTDVIFFSRSCEDVCDWINEKPEMKLACLIRSELSDLGDDSLLQPLWRDFVASGKHESSHEVAAQVVMHGQPQYKEEKSFQVPSVQEGFKFRENDGQSHGERKELQRPTNDIGGNIPFPHHAVDAAETTDSGRVEKSQEEAPLPERQSLRGGLASMERIQAKPFQRNQRRFKGRKYHCGPTQKRHKRSASCESCGKRFLRLSNLRRHFWLHGGTHPPKCSKCRILYRFSSSITSLRRLFLEEQRPKEERIGRVRKPCKDCEKVSTGRTFLRCHQENTHGAGLKTCKECCQKYKRELCQARQQTIHVGLRCSPSGQDLGDDPYLVQLGKADPRRDRFEYQECGANFKRMRHFREHVQGHEQMLACHRCSKSSQLQGGLHKHLPSHGGHVESHCKECKNMLHATSYLKRHMDIQLWARLLLKVSAMHKSSRIEATVENHTRMQQDIPMAEQPW